MDMNLLTITELTPVEAMALAQFAKRLSWTDFRENAVSEDEAYVIKDAIYKLQKSLAESGFDPR